MADNKDQANGKTCLCGCGSPTKSKFAQGHDSKLKAALTQAVRDGSMTPAKAQAAANKISPAFAGKMKRSLELIAAAKASSAK